MVAMATHSRFRDAVAPEDATGVAAAVGAAGTGGGDGDALRFCGAASEEVMN